MSIIAAIPIALWTALISATVALSTALLTSRAAEQKFLREYQLDFAAERVARALLLDSRWPLRSFEVIQGHLGGFEPDELRKVLVRAGAIRFRSQGGRELWGLFERTGDRLGQTIGEEPGNRLADG